MLSGVRIPQLRPVPPTRTGDGLSIGTKRNTSGRIQALLVLSGVRIPQLRPVPPTRTGDGLSIGTKRNAIELVDSIDLVIARRSMGYGLLVLSGACIP